MSTTVTQAFVNQYMALVIHAVNQTKSRLSDCVRTKSNVVGATCVFNKLDDSDPYTGSRHGDTIIADDAHSTATATLKDWYKALLADELDKLKTLVSLDNEYTRNIIAAFQRRKDKSIVVEGLASADSTYSVTGTVNGGLDYATVRKAAGLAEDLEWEEEERYFGWTGAAMETLLDDAELTSKDYSVVGAIQDGRFGPNDRWMGFRWRKLNQAHLASAGVRTGAVGSVTSETLYAWHKDGLGLGVGKEAKVRIAERPDKNHSTQVFGCFSIGACLIDANRKLDIDIVYSGG